jgi:hypothetical protein
MVVRKPKIQKVKEKKKKIIIKVENIGPNKIVVCTEMVMYYTYLPGSGWLNELGRWR